MNATKKQWDELDKNKKDIFLYVVCGMNTNGYGNKYKNFRPTVSQMIEFLGDMLIEIKNNNGFFQKEYYSVSIIKAETLQTFEAVELNVALWEAVKYKLKNYE